MRSSLALAGLLVAMLLAGHSHADDNQDPTVIEQAQKAWDSGDFETARRLFLPLAADGVAEALFRMGMIYEQGLGVEPDPDIAEQFYSGYCPLPPREAL